MHDPCVDLCLHFSSASTEERAAGPHGWCAINLLIGHSQSIFQSSCAISHSFRLRLRVPVPPYYHHHLTLSAFSKLVTLAGVQWYLHMSLDHETSRVRNIYSRIPQTFAKHSEHQALRQTQLQAKTAVSWNVQLYYKTNSYEPLNHRGLKGVGARGLRSREVSPTPGGGDRGRLL